LLPYETVKRYRGKIRKKGEQLMHPKSYLMKGIQCVEVSKRVGGISIRMSYGAGILILCRNFYQTAFQIHQFEFWILMKRGF
jgi:hypothetical protein